MRFHVLGRIILRIFGEQPIWTRTWKHSEASPFHVSKLCFLRERCDCAECDSSRVVGVSDYGDSPPLALAPPSALKPSRRVGRFMLSAGAIIGRFGDPLVDCTCITVPCNRASRSLWVARAAPEHSGAPAGRHRRPGTIACPRRPRKMIGRSPPAQKDAIPQFILDTASTPPSLVRPILTSELFHRNVWT